MFGAPKLGRFRSLASLILVVNVVGELQRKRTLAASRGFLAAARLSCLNYSLNFMYVISDSNILFSHRSFIFDVSLLWTSKISIKIMLFLKKITFLSDNLKMLDIVISFSTINMHFARWFMLVFSKLTQCK